MNSHRLPASFTLSLNFSQTPFGLGRSIMSDCLPTRPKLAAKRSSYAADFDEAERASSGIGKSEVEVTSRPSRSTTIYEGLSRSSTAGKL